MVKSWHTRLERDLIEGLGGTWERKTGTDGELFGRPVEVRAAREDTRYRLGRDVHEELVRERGTYIFHDDELGTRVLPATTVADMMGRGNWLKDRDYPHRFLDVDDVFRF